MRRLLLLLLAFLLPLQLLAATVGDLQPRSGHDDAAGLSVVGHICKSLPQAEWSGSAGLPAWPEVNTATDAVQALSFDAGSGPVDGEDDADAPAAQSELEDHTIPARIATPDIPWQPFPHAFMAALTWQSFVRDELRPPPLA